MSDDEVYVLNSFYLGVAMISQVSFMFIDAAVIALFPTSYRLLHRCLKFVGGKFSNSPSTTASGSDEEEFSRIGSVNSGSFSKPLSWICCRICSRSDENEDLLGARSGRSERQNSF